MNEENSERDLVTLVGGEGEKEEEEEEGKFIEGHSRLRANAPLMLLGRKLMGSLFVMHSITAKDMRHVSAFQGEEEVLIPPNSQFKADRVVTSEPDLWPAAEAQTRMLLPTRKGWAFLASFLSDCSGELSQRPAAQRSAAPAPVGG